MTWSRHETHRCTSDGSYLQCPCLLQTSGTHRWGNQWGRIPPNYTEHQQTAFLLLWGHLQQHPVDIWSNHALGISIGLKIRDCMHWSFNWEVLLTAVASPTCMNPNMSMTSATLLRMSLRRDADIDFSEIQTVFTLLLWHTCITGQLMINTTQFVKLWAAIIYCCWMILQTTGFTLVIEMKWVYLPGCGNMEEASLCSFSITTNESRNLLNITETR